MSELRVLAAVVIACGAWAGIVEVVTRWEPGAWFVLPALVLVLFGPVTAAVLAFLPNPRRDGLEVAAVAAAVIPVALVWLIFVPATSPDKTPVKLLSLPLMAMVGGASALCSWGVAKAMRMV